MRGVWAVIRREYLERVRSKWFILGTVGGPILLIGLMVLPILVAGRSESASRRVVVVDRTGVLYEAVRENLEQGGYELERAERTDDDALARYVAQATEGDIGGVLLLDDSSLERGRARYSARERPSPVRGLTLRGAVTQAALEVRLGADDPGVEALLAGGELDVNVLDSEGAGFDDPRFMITYVGTFLLYMVILFYAVAVMRSTLEEKTSRIVEVVISSIRPWHLMLGKILGVGAVGLTQVAAWIGMGVLTGALGLPALMAARPELSQLGELRDILPGAGYVALFAVFFVGGYFLYAAIYAAVGAMVNTEQEAQQIQMPIIFLLVTPLMFITEVIRDPGSTLSTVMSLVPFFSPLLMFARASTGSAPAWQVALSLVLVFATVVAVAWVAGRIYKVGILMAGKRPTLPELWRWVRES
ncbi:MAG TPA: ABC transporter permease [Longimicrobiales bacterium]